REREHGRIGRRRRRVHRSISFRCTTTKVDGSVSNGTVTFSAENRWAVGPTARAMRAGASGRSGTRAASAIKRTRSGFMCSGILDPPACCARIQDRISIPKVERPTMPETYPRDLIGYGRTPPDPRWPGNARVAVQFVLNYEEGGENSILHGDPASEAFLS